MKDLSKKILAFAILAPLFLAACNSSVKDPKEVFVQPDYTAEDVRKAEEERILAMLKEGSQEFDAIRALWRATILGQGKAEDSELIRKCADFVRKEYDDSIEKDDLAAARRAAVSLEAAGFSGMTALSSSELEKKMERSVSASKYDGKVSSLIRGTVTVWVDKGLKIERGMGYADGMIGSGFFIDGQGSIITNHHVISDVVDPKNEKFSRLYVRLADDPDTKIPAKVVGWDEVLDLALLKAEIDSPFVFALGSSGNLDVGDRIFAIGSPIGLERTLTSGIVSATDRKLFTIGSVLQIDAAVNQGNSGGPLIDQSGKVQGVVFAGMLQFSGLNFVIPVEYLKNELAFLYRGGKIDHSWIGAYGRTKRQGGRNAGLEVQYVMPGGSGFRAGLRTGDTITAFNGLPVTCLEDMQNLVMCQMPGSIARLDYDSDGESRSACVYLEVRPKNPGYKIYQSDLLANSFEPLFGMRLVSLSSGGRKYSIASILKGSAADNSNFSANDPVEIRNIEFNGEKTAIQAEIATKNRKKGYLDVAIAIAAPLDSPYYF